MIFFVRAEGLQLTIFNTVESAIANISQQLRYCNPFSFQFLGKPLRAEIIDHLERPLFPIGAQFHRLIHGSNIIGNLRHK